MATLDSPPSISGVVPPQERVQRPLSVTLIGWFFIIAGVYAAVEIVVSFIKDNPSLNFGVFLILVGHGLLRLRRAAYLWTMFILIVAWMGLAFTLIVCGLLGRGDVHLGDSIVSGWKRLLTIWGFGALYAALLWWMTRTLTQPHIEALFLKLTGGRAHPEHFQ